MSRISGQRGQTSIDFVVGAAVFLLAVAFVLAFVPSMFAPFFGMGAADAIVGDRSAAYLAENALVEDTNNPAILDADKVESFFLECQQASNTSWLQSELGTGTDQINVTIEGSDGIATIHNTELSCGTEPSGSETVSKRFVSIDEAYFSLRVVVW